MKDQLLERAVDIKAEKKALAKARDLLSADKAKLEQGDLFLAGGEADALEADLQRGIEVLETEIERRDSEFAAL